ncbi:transposase [Embleya hyalina]|uniref:Transposase n=1 Tax=Embleya hyalina TaxID=516124 RepID=A0A401YNE1_9ACTN|nr:transposase [Embleya hyalina]
MRQLVRIAGTRRAIEECFQAAKDECGPDRYEVRRYTRVAMGRHAGACAPEAARARDAMPPEPPLEPGPETPKRQRPTLGDEFGTQEGRSPMIRYRREPTDRRAQPGGSAAPPESTSPRDHAPRRRVVPTVVTVPPVPVPGVPAVASDRGPQR